MAELMSIYRHQLLDFLWSIQDKYGYIRDQDVRELSDQFKISEIELEGVISFYHFFHRKHPGDFTIYLNDSIVSEFKGFKKIKTAFERTLNTKIGNVDPSGKFGLYSTSCIGMSDQEPAALINFKPFIKLTPTKVNKIIYGLKSGQTLDQLCDQPEDNIQRMPNEEKRIFAHPYKAGESIKRIKGLTPEKVIENIREAGLTGMGGAFFPTHIKWSACRSQEAIPKYIVCNADEGEPGTFKDRVIMQRMPGLLIEGMIIAAYAVGAVEGTIYLRAEYRYLKSKLEEVIRKFEWNNWLGKDILGIEGFDFSLKIQLGAGAYVCGEETALLQSMEGKRGEPRPRKYFPVERGFLDKPTVVNNVETLCAAARILELGVKHFRNCGTPTSPGTKILSISGDCLRPGIYEVQWGLNIGELLDMCGAEDAFALQLSGPSGTLIPASQRERKISIDDLRCGGSVMIFNQNRDLLQILQNYNRFFMSESCGTCTPCRAGNFLLFRQLRAFKRGLADLSDIQKLEELGQMMRFSSRCGLGQAAPNSILDSIKYFRDKWDEMAISNGQPLNKLFDLEDATAEYDQYIKEFNQE